MATTHELSAHTEDDNDDAAKRARRLMFHPAPKSAGEFHMATDEHILARPLLHEQVEKDDDDEDEDKEKSRFDFRHEDHDEEPVAFTESPMVEVPLHDVNMPSEEFIEPLPLPPVETVSEQDDEDEQPQQPMFSRTSPPIIRPAEQTRVMRPTAAELIPDAQAAPTSEAIVLGAAEETVASAAEAAEEAPEALVATPTNPANPNVQPPTHNILPPTPNTPPQNPNAGGNNMPPVPPNHGGGGGGGFNGGNFNNVPPPNNNPNYQYANMPPINPNAHLQYAANASGNTVTHVIEREHTVERGSGNLLAAITFIGLLMERSKRKGGDAKLEKKIKEQRKELEEQSDQLQRQNETIVKQGRELNTANLRTTELEKHAAERRRVAEAFGTVETPSASAPRPVAERPTPASTVERRTPGVASVERNAVANAVEATEEDGVQPKQFELQPDQHIERSAWHNIVVDSHGREVVDAMQYGQGFQQERQREVAPAAPRDTQVAGAQAATPIGVPLPNAFNPSLPAGMTNPALPADERSPYENMYNNPQYMLEAPNDHRARNAATTFLLWLLVAGLAFGIVSAVRLLF